MISGPKRPEGPVENRRNENVLYGRGLIYAFVTHRSDRAFRFEGCPGTPEAVRLGARN